MSEPLATLYALALRTLDAQERRVGELRARLAPVLAAGGLGTTLLAGPAVDGAAGGDPLALLAICVALVGLSAALTSAGRLLLSREDDLDIRALRLARWLQRDDRLDDERAFYAAMLLDLDARSVILRRLADRLHARFTVIVYGMLVELCGLATAAVIG